MPKLYCLLPLLFAFAFTSMAQQPPRALWSRYILNAYQKPPVGDKDQVIYDAKLTKEGSLIVAGADTGTSIAKNAILAKGVAARPWIMKISTGGMRIWYGNINNQFLNVSRSAFLSVQEIIDPAVQYPGYVAAGYAGDTRDADPSKFYIAKFDNYGVFQWDKMYGGTGNDKAFCVQQLNNRGFIAAGFTTSGNGDVTDNHQAGKADVWLLRLNNTGDILWKKCFGGTESDTAYAVIQTADKGFLVAGTSSSANGDLSANSGATDAWLFKTDSLGNLLWQKNYGGSGDEAFKSVIENSDGSFTLTGFSTSASVPGATNSGRRDLWAVKTTADGDIIWSKLFGGTQDEQGFSVQSTPDGHLLLSGYSESNNGFVSGNSGGADAWLLKLSQAGNLLWQKCAGTSNDEVSFASICLPGNRFMMAGFGRQPGYSDYDGYLMELGYSNTIKGILFKDDNGNGIKEVNETLFNQQAIIKIERQGGGFSNSLHTYNGRFELEVDTGAYTASVQANLLYYQIVPAFANSNFATYFNKDSFNFALQTLSSKKDLSVQLFSLEPPRPGATVNYRLVYRNVGTVPIPSGEVVFKKDSKVNVSSLSKTPTTINGDTLKWSYTNFLPGDSAWVDLSFQVKNAPSVNVNDTLSYTAFIDPVADDETPSDDTIRLLQLVNATIVSNGMSENNAGSIPVSFVANGNYLLYTIRLQNTGTGTVPNLEVKDTLSNQLDPASMQMVAASHPYNLVISDNNKLTWQFNSIQLPDSNISKSGSRAYIAFRVRPKPTVTPGSIINNRAAIYFEPDLPVMTNNAATLVTGALVTLPQELLELAGNQRNGVIRLSWKLAVSPGLKRFGVERSIDGNRFTEIGSVLQEPTKLAYSYFDTISRLSAKAVFYRLTLVEQNGRHTHSQVLPFSLREINTNKIEVYPNPVFGQSYVAFRTQMEGVVDMQVLNAAGSLIRNQRITVTEGKNVILLAESGRLRPGIYFVRLISGNMSVQSIPFIVK